MSWTKLGATDEQIQELHTGDDEMTMMKRFLTEDDVAIELYPQDEDESPHDSQLSALGSDPNAEQGAADYAKAVQGVLAGSPIWGWCVAVIKVSWGPFEEKQYLGNCSYYSADDFRENSGYYGDMIKDLLRELNVSVELVLNDLLKIGCI